MAGASPAMTARSLRRVQRQRNRLDAGEIKLVRRVVDIEPDHVAIGIEIDIEPFDNLPRLRARRALQLDIEAVRLRIVVQLHGSSSRKLRSKNALWTVSPSSSVTTRRNRGLVSPLARILPQKRTRPSSCTARRTGAASTSRHHSRSM